MYHKLLIHVIVGHPLAIRNVNVLSLLFYVRQPIDVQVLHVADLTVSHKAQGNLFKN